jgi:hypothetical protein
MVKYGLINLPATAPQISVQQMHQLVLPLLLVRNWARMVSHKTKDVYKLQVIFHLI